MVGFSVQVFQCTSFRPSRQKATAYWDSDLVRVLPFTEASGFGPAILVHYDHSIWKARPGTISLGGQDRHLLSFGMIIHILVSNTNRTGQTWGLYSECLPLRMECPPVLILTQASEQVPGLACIMMMDMTQIRILARGLSAYRFYWRILFLQRCIGLNAEIWL